MDKTIINAIVGTIVFVTLIFGISRCNGCHDSERVHNISIDEEHQTMVFYNRDGVRIGKIRYDENVKGKLVFE